MKPAMYKRLLLLPVYLVIWLAEHSLGFIGEACINAERKVMDLRWRLDDWSWGRGEDK